MLDGRNDILTLAIGTSEHGGRVRGVGQRHKQSTYFGRSRQQHHIDVNEQLATMEAKLRAEFEEKFAEECRMYQQSLMETLKSMGLSKSTENIKCIKEMGYVDGSGRGSCSAAK